MKLPELSEFQFQSAARSKEFDPLQLPDPNPSLQQNLGAIQRSFANLEQSGKLNAEALYGQQPKKLSTSEVIGQFAELLPEAVKTASQLQEVDVAIQMARADDRYYQMLQQGLIPQNGELMAIEQNEKAREGMIQGAAAEVATQTNNYDTVRGILNFSNHGEIALRRRTARHMFQNVYPEWMTTQLETNDTEVMVEDGQGGMVKVRINEPDLPDFQHKQIMSHLRTAFMGHELLSDTNNDLIQEEMAIGFTTDAKITTAYSRTTRANDGTKRFNAGYTAMFEDFAKGDLESLGKFQVNAKSMYDKKGVNLLNTPKEFFNRLITDVGTAAENGAEFPIGEFIMKAKTEDGQTFMQRAPRQAALLMRTYRDKRRTYLTNKLKGDKQDLVFSIASFNKESLAQPKTVAEYVEFKGVVRQKAAELGIPEKDLMTLLDEGQRVASYGADELNELRNNAEIALATGNASKSAEYYTHPVVGPEYREKVDKQVDRIKTPEYKLGSEEISATFKNIHRSMVDPFGRLKGDAIQVNAHYQRIYDNKYDELIQKNESLPEGQRLTPVAIANEARDAAIGQWAKDSQDESHKFYVNPKNGSFPNFPRPQADQAEAALQTNIANLTANAKTSQGVLTEVAKTPAQLGLTDERTRQILANYQTYGIVDPELRRQAKLINNSVGRIVVTNPMQLAIAAGQGLGILKPGEVPQSPAFLQRAASQKSADRWLRHIQSIGGDLYTDSRQYGPIAQMPTRPGMPVMPLFSGSSEPQGLQGLTASDFRELAFIVSGEAKRNTDDEYAVAASAINRLGHGGYGRTLHDIARRPGQYEAVFGTKTARYEEELIKKLSSPEGQKKIAQMLIALEGRTDFKGQSQLRNRDPDNDPMFDPEGNFYHYTGQTGKGAYTGTINRNYLRFIR